MKEIARITHIHQVTHDVKCFRVSKPIGYTFEPGQATEVSINKPGWENERRPFTFTGLNENEYLEFNIKIYADRKGVTDELNRLRPGDELILRDVWGAIAYKGEGCFIAGGAGITPFIAIIRQLKKDNALKNNRLFFSNKTVDDIILKKELDEAFGNQVEYVLSNENRPGFFPGHIDRLFLERHITDLSKPVYICGPDKMVSDLDEVLINMGASPQWVVFEQ